MCGGTGSGTCEMRRRWGGQKYEQMRVYLFNDSFVWVSSSDKFQGRYSFYDPDVCAFVAS